MLLIMLQFITFARLGATAGAINFNKGELIPSSPVATFDGSGFMFSKTSRSEIKGILKFFNFLTKTSEQHKGRLLVVVSFFVYFRRVSSLTETSSGNEYN